MMCEHDSQRPGPGLGEKGAEPPCKADNPLAACFIHLSNRQTRCKGEDISSYASRRQAHVGSVAMRERKALMRFQHLLHLHAYTPGIRAPPQQRAPPALVVRSQSKGSLTAKRGSHRKHLLSPEREELSAAAWQPGLLRVSAAQPAAAPRLEEPPSPKLPSCESANKSRSMSFHRDVVFFHDLGVSVGFERLT